MVTDALTLLKEARVILTTMGWAQDAPQGEPWVQAEDAPVCLGFAIARAYWMHDRARDWIEWSDTPGLLSALKFNGSGECFRWNDTPGRTKAEVFARLDVAIASLEN